MTSNRSATIRALGNQRRTSIDIHPGTSIGSHFFIDPGAGVAIGANSTIGANVFLLQCVPANSLVIYEEKQLSILDKLARRIPHALE